MDAPRTYDLAVAWNWEYDREFINQIKDTAIRNNISVLEIHAENVDSIFNLHRRGGIQFHYFLDRASDEDEQFQPLARYVLAQYRAGTGTVRPINPHDYVILAADKATMHLEFLSHGIEVPYTIIISPYCFKNDIELSITELARLGRPFIIKPANTTGGGIGVVMGAETLKEVIEARQNHVNDKYLLQETIKPIELDGRRAWFRVFYAFGEIIPCWWDDITHVYSPVGEQGECESKLERLRSIAEHVHSVCKLEFFSTEMVCTADNRCVAVDYVNEMCDMRLQSSTYDGVPDATVERIITQMMDFIKREVRLGRGRIPCCI